MNVLKKILIGLGIVIVLVLGLAVVLVATFDPNDYKDTIATKIKEQTGRELEIAGDIKLTLYPWLGLDVAGISLSNAAGFGDKPFLKTEVIKVRAKLLPLLRKELEMDTLVLHGATVNLARNADGVSNWDDLVKPEESGEKKKSPEPAFAALVLGGIDIKDANIYWQDKQQDVSAKITDVAISTGELKLGEPIAIKAGLNAAATKPALSSRIDFNGTVFYEDNGDILTLKPMLLESTVKGAAIPGGETRIKLTSEIRVDMDEYVAQVNGLELTAFDTELQGQLEAADYQTGKPAIKGTLDLKGKDLPQLFKIFEIEPLASQLAGIQPKNFEVKTTFDADLKRNDLNISDLSVDVLGNKVNANILARDVQSTTPAVKGMVKASGANLPILVSLASQLKGDGKDKVAALSKELQSAPKPFSVETEFDLDMKAGTVNMPSLAIDALGTKTTGTITGKQLQSSKPALQGGININGDDLPTLIRIAAAFSGDGKQDLGPLIKELKAVPAAFNVDTQFDSGSGAIEVSKLAIKALGLTADGKLSISNFTSDAPAVKGELKANGPDLPLLMLVAGSMQGKDSGLAAMAKDLGKVKDKQFSLVTQFDTDLESGKIDLPSFSFKSLGIDAEGKLKGKNIQAGGNMDGKLVIAGSKPAPLLTALGQGDLAQVLQSFKVDTGISGNTNELSLKPLSLAAVFAGKQIPNSPVTLSVNADTNINLEKELLELKSLKIDGLGLDVNGNVTATKFKTAPEFTGKVEVAPFNLRQFLISLNQEVPKTADPEVLKRLSLTTGFAGTANSIAMNGLKAQLDDSKLQGDIKLSSFSPLDLEFGLGIDQLNLDRYLTPQAKQEKKAAATPEAVAAGAAAEIPVETLRAIKIKGDFVMGQFVVSNARLSDLELSIRADKGDIKLSPVNAKLYDGSYSGDIVIDATGKEPKLTTNTNLVGVQTEPLLLDVTGSGDLVSNANIQLSLNTSGANTDLMKQRLSGKGEIKVLDGIFRGLDINKVLEQVEIMLESKRFGKVDTSGQTEFESLTATLDIKNGVVDNRDMLMQGKGFKVKGEGMMVNLNDETWKYNLTVINDPSSATRGEERFNIGGYDILIKCRDKIADKKCLPDLGSMIDAVMKDTVKKELQDKLGEKLGLPIPGAQKQSAPAPAPAPTAPAPQPGQQSTPPAEQPQQQQEKPADPEDIIKEELGKGLKKLFDF